MSDERLQILKMVAEGKVSAEEAERLLDALENGKRPPTGPRATHVRIHFTEGKKVTNFSVGVGLARWVLSLPLIRIDFGQEQLDTERLVSLIDGGATGQVVAISQDDRKLEVWLDP